MAIRGFLVVKRGVVVVLVEVEVVLDFGTAGRK